MNGSHDSHESGPFASDASTVGPISAFTQPDDIFPELQLKVSFTGTSSLSSRTVENKREASPAMVLATTFHLNMRALDFQGNDPTAMSFSHSSCIVHEGRPDSRQKFLTQYGTGYQ